jgi:hypothetical protein
MKRYRAARAAQCICIGTLALAAGLFAGLPSQACTLWGAAGELAAGRGTLVAKNRDWLPDHRQQLSIVRPKEGYASVVLVAIGGAEPGTKAGVNEKGLVIVSATASQVPAADRNRADRKKGLINRLLSRCAGVDEVLARIHEFDRPVFYLIGDRKEIAVIEVAPDGNRSISRTNSGVLHHTNHYEAIDPPGLARRPSVSSKTRSERIADLLKTADGPYTAEDFIRFSQDRDAGPDNSIWRTGGGPSKRRTLATWLVSIPAGGSPQLYLNLANPGEAERVCRIDIQTVLKNPQSGSRDGAEALCPPPTPQGRAPDLDPGPP